MDLVAGVRKEGSRGGRGDFKWSDVKESAHRENYLGHSLMAPVGRWQQGKDLHWYTRAQEDDQDRVRREREEKQRVKNAEEEAMARVLGLPAPLKAPDMNANSTPLGGKHIQKTREDTTGDDDLHGADLARDARRASYQGDTASRYAATRDRARRQRGERSRSPRRDRRSDRHNRDKEMERRRYRHREGDDHDRGHHYSGHRSNQRRFRSQSRDGGHRKVSRSRAADKDEHRRHRPVDRGHSPGCRLEYRPDQRGRG